MTDIYYLGPEGTFTHQAAIAAAEGLASHGEHDARLHACADVPQILRHVAAGEGLGVIAWENNVEGYVVPNLDMMIDATDVAAFMRVGVDVTFDAFVTPATVQNAQDREHILASCSVVTAHPHGLAQCRAFADRYGLRAVPASSNAAACRDLREGEVGLGPSICGELYGLERVATERAGSRTHPRILLRRHRPPARFGSMPRLRGPLWTARCARVVECRCLPRPARGRGGARPVHLRRTLWIGTRRHARRGLHRRPHRIPRHRAPRPRATAARRRTGARCVRIRIDPHVHSARHRPRRARRSARRGARRGTQHDEFHLPTDQRARWHLQFHRDPRCGAMGTAFP